MRLALHTPSTFHVYHSSAETAGSVDMPGLNLNDEQKTEVKIHEIERIVTSLICQGTEECSLVLCRQHDRCSSHGAEYQRNTRIHRSIDRDGMEPNS